MKLIEISSDGKYFTCVTSVDSGGDRVRATLRCSKSASNMYVHIKTKHPSIYGLIEPIIRSRELKKRSRTQCTTISDIFARSRQRAMDEAFLCFFSSPDIQKSMIEHPRFQELLRSMSPNVLIPTVKTLTSRLWDKFYATLNTVKEKIYGSEFTVLKSESWSTFQNEAVLGFMVSYVDEELNLQTRCVGNIAFFGRHTESDVAEVITKVVQERLGGRTPDYFLLDSAPVKKSGVRRFMNNEGDDYWYPWSVHFCQLAMKEAMFLYLNGANNTDQLPTRCEWNEFDQNDILEQISMAKNASAFDRLTSTCRAICSEIRRSHSYAELFDKYQLQAEVFNKIAMDVKTRFGSTVKIFESVLNNQSVLMRMEEAGRRNNSVWTLSFHSFPDNWILIQNIVSVQRPVQDATYVLSSNSAILGDVLPVFTSVVVNVQNLEVTTNVLRLRSALIDCLSCRIQRILSTEQSMPFFRRN